LDGTRVLVNRVFDHLSPSRWQRTLLIIFATAILVRAGFVLSLQDGFYFPDSLDYSASAVTLMASREFGDTFRRAPVYPVFLAGIYLLFGQQILTIRLVEALLGAGLAIVIAVLARRIGGEDVGALGGLLWSIYPTGVFIVGLVYPTNLATFLLACAVLCIMPQKEQGLAPGRVIAGGICFGLAALTVPVVVATVFIAGLWIIYWQPTRRLILTSLLLLGFAVVFVPWTVRNYNVYDAFVLVEPRVVELLPSMPSDVPTHATRKVAGASQANDKISAILENPGAFARRFAREFRYFWELYPERLQMNRPTFREKMHQEDPRVVRETVFGTSWTSVVSLLSEGFIFLFALLGIAVMSFQKARRRDLSLLCITILSFAVGYSFFWGKMRYRIPIEPYIVILCAYGLRQIGLSPSSRFARDPVPAAATPQKP
jgi:4-amino-4-deoxy-L-arabinose transferase-like glycosyltransferase